MVRPLANAAEYAAVVAEARGALIVIDMYATWCGPCVMFAPRYAKMATEYPDVVFCKADVERATDLAQRFNVSAMPTFVLVRNDQLQSFVVGANGPALEGEINKYRDASTAPPPNTQGVGGFGPVLKIATRVLYALVLMALFYVLVRRG